MERLAYFAAHAPAVIPGWFIPKGFEEPPKSPGGPSKFAIKDADTIEALKSWAEDPAWDIEADYPGDQAVAQFVAEWRSFWEKRARYNDDLQRELHFQWPIYWAEQVLNRIPSETYRRTM